MVPICRIVEKFESIFILRNVKTIVRRHNSKTVENIATVKASVAEDSHLSIPHRSQELGVKKTTTWRIWSFNFTPV